MPRYFASSPVIAGEEGLFGTWSSFSAARESAKSVDIGTLGRNCAGPKTLDDANDGFLGVARKVRIGYVLGKLAAVNPPSS